MDLSDLFANDLVYTILLVVVLLAASGLVYRLLKKPVTHEEEKPVETPEKPTPGVDRMMGEIRRDATGETPIRPDTANDTVEVLRIMSSDAREVTGYEVKPLGSTPPVDEARPTARPVVVPPKPEVKPEPAPAPKPEAKPAPVAPAPKPEAKPAPAPAPKPEVKPAPVAPAPKPEAKPAPVAPAPRSLEDGLAKTKGGFIAKLNRLFFGGKNIDDNVFEELEEILYEADIGPTATKLFQSVVEQAKRNELKDASRLKDLLRDDIRAILARAQTPLVIPEHKPYAILVVGVNGVGKTTTIGKLAHRFAAQGKHVILAAGDTFRAAASEQLNIWGERAGVEVISGEEGSNPSGIIYSGAAAAKAKGADVFIADTAGRLHTKYNLMEELRKMQKVCAKALEREPDEIWLVIDANTGQNAVNQVQKFHEAMGLTGLILTKLDGTAKGGVVIGITDQLSLPIRYIGIGEGIDDLREFDADAFVKALL